MKKIGLFGGTFDPIHFGHIHIALEMKEKLGLDEVLFSPAALSPSKSEIPCRVSGKDRLAMLRWALEDLRGSCRAIDYELQKEGPSYTIDLVRYVKKHICESEDRLFLILGEDLSEGFSQWKECSEIIALATPAVGTRGDRKGDFRIGERVELSRMDISSSEIRERLKNNLYCGHLVPAKVLDYIYINQLYH